MPLTFLSHQAAVVPVKLRWPDRFDGVALVAGSMAPDLAYVASGTGLDVNAHRWPQWLIVAVPMALLAAMFIRWLAPTTFPHLSNAFGTDWRRFAALGSKRHSAAVTMGSALLGVITHVVWDGFTHTTRWGAQLFPWLADGSLLSYSPAKVFQYTSHLLGAVVLLWLIRSCEPEIDPPEKPTRDQRLVFWSLLLGGILLGGVWGRGEFLAAIIIKSAWGAAAGLAFYRVIGDRLAKPGRTQTASSVPAKHA